MTFGMHSNALSQSAIIQHQQGSRDYSTLRSQQVSDYLDSLNFQMIVVRDSVHDLGVVQAYQQVSLQSGALQITGESLMDELHVISGTELDGNVEVGGNLTITGTTSGITSAMVGLGNADNTSDADKPVSTAAQTALDLKAPLASPTFTGTVSGITSAMVGLGNADNTSDANKPVSTAAQTALDLKAPLASPTFTGTPSLPTGTTAVTQSAADNSTKLATTAYVDAAMSGAGSSTTDLMQEVTVVSDGETSFTLTQTPAGSSVVRVFRNGVLLSESATSISGTSVTYVSGNNGGANLVAGDRIQFFYAH